MWADDNCLISREMGPRMFYVFSGSCIITGKLYSVRVPGPELFAYRQGLLIQDAMPSVSRNDREFLISGISPEGFQTLYPDE